MLDIERQNEILDILKIEKSITVEKLSKDLYVSPATIRRDLKAMESIGVIKRTHGGAMLFQSIGEEAAYAIREHENTHSKRTIAMLASKLIKNGDSIFLDSSSTVEYLIPLLSTFTSLTVTTIGLRNALLLSQTDIAKIYIAGGQIQNHSNSVLGSDTVEFISRMHADISFVSCSGIDLNNGCTDSSIEQTKIKQQFIKNSKKSCLLVDSSKFDKTLLCTDFYIDDLDYIITDSTPSNEYLQKINSTKCKLITPENS